MADDAHTKGQQLVQEERDRLTVQGEPGEGHRRRDQTAGKEAQEIAAEQVRVRNDAGSPQDQGE